jgi:hypothetical protein
MATIEEICPIHHIPLLSVTDITGPINDIHDLQIQLTKPATEPVCVICKFIGVPAKNDHS